MDDTATATARRVIAATTELALCSGSLAEASRRLGKRRNYFSRVRERGAMEWGSYFSTLALFEVDHLRATQWAHCVDSAPALEQFGEAALAIALGGELPTVRALRLAFLQGRLEGSPLGAVQRAFANEMDELRHGDPARVVVRTEQALAQATSSVFAARLLGVLASALRLEHRLNEAKVVLWTGIRIAATERSCPTLLGDLIQRTAYIEGDLGRQEQAIALTETACAHYERARLPDLLARALVDRGLMLHRAGIYPPAGPLLQRALCLLPDHDHRHRCTALHLLGDMSARQGALKDARAHMRAAMAQAPSGRQTVGQLRWLQARIAVVERRFDTASKRYAQTAEAFGIEVPIDAALVAAEHTRLLVRHGQSERARCLSDALRWAVIPLEDRSPNAAAALTDLIIASEQAAFQMHAEALARRLETAIVAVAGERVAQPRA